MFTWLSSLRRDALLFSSTKKWFSTSRRRDMKVTVCGACGGIGQPLCLLLKLSSIISELSLYDIKNTPAVRADLSHINVKSKVTGHTGPENLGRALKGAQIVVIAAGTPRNKACNDINELFNTNALVVFEIIEAISILCPNAVVAIITHPVNSLIPLAAELLKKKGVFNPNRLFGVTTVDVVRASSFVGELKEIDPQDVHVPVICGNSERTTIPVFSQSFPNMQFSEEEVRLLTKRVQEAGSEIYRERSETGTATLSPGFAAARFTLGLARSLSGEYVIEYAYVASDTLPGVGYFASPLLLGRNGIEKNLGLPKLDSFESSLLRDAVGELKMNIKKGEDYVKNK